MSDQIQQQQDAPPAEPQGAAVAATDPAVNPNPAVDGTTTAIDPNAAPPAADQQQPDQKGLTAEVVAEAERAASQEIIDEAEAAATAAEGETDARAEGETKELDTETPEQYLRRTLTALKEKREEVKGTPLGFLQIEINKRLVGARGAIEGGAYINRVNEALKNLRVVVFLLQDLLEEKNEASSFGLRFAVIWIQDATRDARDYLANDGELRVPFTVTIKRLKGLLFKTRTAVNNVRAKNKGHKAGALAVFDEVFDDLAPKPASQPAKQPADDPAANKSADPAPAAASNPAPAQSGSATICLGCGQPLPAEYAASGYHRRCAPKSSKPTGNDGKDKSEGGKRGRK